MRKLRLTLALVFGIFIAIFGVFLFSNLNYQNVPLEFIFQEQFAKGNFFEGMYTLWASGFMCDWWAYFSPENIEQHGVISILFSSAVFPAVMTWFSAGFISGALIQKPKHGFYIAMGLFSFMVVFWVIWMILAGVDLAQMFTSGIYATSGKLFTGLLWINIGGILGGTVSNPAFD